MTNLEFLDTAITAFYAGLRPFPPGWHTLPFEARLAIAKEVHASIAADQASAAKEFVRTHKRLFQAAAKAPPVRARGPRMIPTTRNLIYHVCALKENDGWRDNILQLQKRMHIFNGKRVVAVAKGPGIHDPDEVLRELPGCEYLILPNCQTLREAATFLPLALSVASTDPSEVTFYAHTKSNSTADDQRGAWAWTKAMYHFLLDEPSEVMLDLVDHLAVGINQGIWHGGTSPFPSKLNWAGWAFFGTFWWFRHDAVFTDPDWMKFPLDRYIVEAWLGKILPPERCKSRFQPWPLHQWPAPSPYDESLYPVLPNA